MALTYKTLSSNFAKVKDKDVAQLGTFIGGKVGENIKSKVFKTDALSDCHMLSTIQEYQYHHPMGPFLLVLIKMVSLSCV